MNFEYIPKSEKQLKSNYTSRIKKELNEFPTFQDFKNWYDTQSKECFYCGLTEIESQQIVKTGLLTSNRFPTNGKVGQGRSRGMWLEVDRINPKGNYSTSNSVLCCYFCNNDKSDVFSGEQYKNFFQNRLGFLKSLLSKQTNK